MKRTDEQSVKNIRKATVLAAFLLVLLIGYLLLGLFFDFYIPCPFRTVTGFRCPGCGLSHAAVSLAHLDIRAAFYENALFLPIYLYIIYVACRYFYYLISNKSPLSDSIGKRIDLLFLVVIIIWWPLRNILGI